MIVGDAANFLLGGIPGDLHDMFVVDVEPDDLARASTTLRDMSVGVRTLHVKLSGKVASFDGSWQGDGKDVFNSELWQPLSHGLGVLERECEYTADKFATLATQAAEAHAEKVAALNQEIQTQLWIIGATTVVGSPEVGGVISKAVVGLATRLGGETVGSIVAAIVKVIEALIEKVVAALGKVMAWATKGVAFATEGTLDNLGTIVRKVLRDDADGGTTQVAGPSVGSGRAALWDANKLNHIFGETQHGLNTVVQALGGESKVMDAAQASLTGADVPSSGLFEVTRMVGGQTVTIRGVVENGVPMIGTIFVVP